jgi:iron complex transport system ATP-binding protein
LRDAVRAGAAVLAVVHDLALAARFADCVVVMDRGQIVAAAPPNEVLSSEHIATVFGVEAVLLDASEGTIPIARRPL